MPPTCGGTGSPDMAAGGSCMDNWAASECHQCGENCYGNAECEAACEAGECLRDAQQCTNLQRECQQNDPWMSEAVMCRGEMVTESMMDANGRCYERANNAQACSGQHAQDPNAECHLERLREALCLNATTGQVLSTNATCSAQPGCEFRADGACMAIPGGVADTREARCEAATGVSCTYNQGMQVCEEVQDYCAICKKEQRQSCAHEGYQLYFGEQPLCEEPVVGWDFDMSSCDASSGCYCDPNDEVKDMDPEDFSTDASGTPWSPETGCPWLQQTYDWCEDTECQRDPELCGGCNNHCDGRGPPSREHLAAICPTENAACAADAW